MELERIKFYADVHIAEAVAVALRREGIDFVRAGEIDLLHAIDEVHLARAAAEGRVLVTQDVDFIVLHQQGVSHSGIAYFHQGAGIGYIVGQLLLLHGVLSAAEMRGHLEYL